MNYYDENIFSDSESSEETDYHSCVSSQESDSDQEVLDTTNESENRSYPESPLDRLNRSIEAATNSRYKVLECIGSGKYGHVYAGNDLTNGYQVAIKLTSHFSNSEYSIERYDFFAKLTHKNLIQYLDYFVSDDYLSLVMELAPNGSLRSALKERRLTRDFYSERRIVQMFVDLLLGVEHLHRNGCIHRDLKPDNIVIGLYGCLKIIDFDAAKIDCFIESTTYGMASQMGAQCAAPELLKHEPYDKNVDIWSLGVILFEMAELRHPYWHQPPPRLIPRMSQRHSEDLKEVVEMTMAYYSHQRCSIEEIKRTNLIYNVLG